MNELIMYRIPNSARIMQKCDCGATIDFIHGSSVPGKCHMARFVQESHVGVVRYILRDDFDAQPDQTKHTYVEWNDFAVANGYEIIPLDTYRPLEEGSRMVMYGFSAAIVITTQDIWEITIALHEDQEQEEQEDEEQEDPYDYDGEHHSDWATDESDWD
jgi:hypothetical protein